MVVAGNLHALAVEQLERLEQNSTNSSKPPSLDNPFVQEAVEFDGGKTQTAKNEKNLTSAEEVETALVEDNAQRKPKAQGFGKRSQGLQLGAKGMWRTTPARSKNYYPSLSRELRRL